MNTKINYKKIIFACFVLISGWFLTKIYLNNTRVKNPLLVHLNNQEEVIWQQFEQNGINRIDFEQKSKAESQNRPKKEVTHAVSDELATMLTQTAHDFGLNPNEFSFDYMTDPSEAATDADTIFINEQLFKQLPKKACKFVIGHEMQHLKYNDSIGRIVLEDMLQECKAPKTEALLDSFIRFQETRADISAALKNEEYAQSYCAFMDYVIKLGNTLENPEYPTNQQRLRLAQQTYDYVNKTNGITV